MSAEKDNMKIIKIMFVTLGLLGAYNSCAAAGDIRKNSVPGSINYQGRIEKDNAPITGGITLYFRIYDANGTFIWETPRIDTVAVQGLFSASITPPWNEFSTDTPLYLEVQTGSDILTPREPLNSVAYAIVAKKLEDGASVEVATLTATGNVGFGADATGDRLTVNGNIHLLGDSSGICFSNNACFSADTLGNVVGTVVGHVTNPGDVTIKSGTNGIGNMLFETSNIERMRISDASNSGRIGIGAGALAAPKGTVDIDGSLYVGSEGIY